MWLQLRLYLLVTLLFALVYAAVTVIASVMEIGDFMMYGIIASAMLILQWLLGPKLVEMSMGVRYVSRAEYPEIYRAVEELSVAAGIPVPRIGISQIPIPNAFAFGRWRGDGRICITNELTRMLSFQELRAVIGHEIAHLKHSDVAVITFLSVFPTVFWFIARSTMFYSYSGRRRGNEALIGIVAFLLYFITNLLVLYASRIREYYADERSVRLGNPPHALASALYKLVYGSARVSKENMKPFEGLKAFFLNDPSRALNEIRELAQVDTDRSGSIDQHELLMLSTKKVKIGLGDMLMELMSTHPNMVKRVQRLSKIAM
ncbi:MAG TPA: M48 family metalloprotease [Candidatus Methanoperedenaceae archaeon]|nr:M48 family metalloprotease [Candidatus Methanoperedenaceae archaeon]